MNIIDPSTIDLLTLASASLEQRDKLPTTPCVYFAINNQEIVQYIGISNNPRKRWKAHHRGVDLALLGEIRIAYLESDPALLPEIERAMIAYFRPALNETRRQKGYGTGYVESKPIVRNGQEYPQYWYHYEEWSKGDRLVKSSKYIPKKSLKKVQRLNEEKAPVREILRLLEGDKK